MTIANRASGSLPASDPLYAPLIKWRPRQTGDVAYWIAPAPDVRKGYAPKSIALDPALTQLEIAARCRHLFEDLATWRKAQGNTAAQFSISWVIKQYQTDQHSPYHKIRHVTRRSYDDACKIIDRTIGTRRIDPVLEGGILRPRIQGHDIRRWHSEWGRPDDEGIATAPARARYLIVMLRILFSYAVELAVPGAPDVRNLLSTMQFPTAPPRDSAPTRDQVLAIVKTALGTFGFGYPSIAATTLAQFEFTERRVHIIGAWEGAQWRPGWLWSGVSKDWVIAYHQTKKGRVERSYDLKDTPALLEILQLTPEERRIGPIMVCETTGKPWHYRHYIEIFRKIARAAGIPDEVWSMDMRAGGATEAGNIQGVASFDIQAAGGWSDPKTASRYTRDRVNRAQNVVRLRQRERRGNDS